MRRRVNHPIRNQLGEERRRVWDGRVVVFSLAGRALRPWSRRGWRTSWKDVLCAALSGKIARLAMKSGHGGVDELDREKSRLTLNTRNFELRPEESIRWRYTVSLPRSATCGASYGYRQRLRCLKVALFTTQLKGVVDSFELEIVVKSFQLVDYLQRLPGGVSQFPAY